MKRFLTIIICISMILTFAACSSANNTSLDTSVVLSSQSETNSSDCKISEELVSTDISSVTSEVSSEAKDTSSVVSQKPAQNTASNTNPDVKPAENTETSTFDHFMPSVIASRCNHVYEPAGCDYPSFCKFCKELCRDNSYEQQSFLPHNFVNNKCTICKKDQKSNDSNLVDFNSSYYSIGQEITIDLSFTDINNSTVTIYPCVTLEKCIDAKNNIWIPYEGLYEVGEFFALEARPGGIITSDKGVRYGRWDIMSNEILQNNPDANVENLLLNRLIRRFKVTFSEPGSYRVLVYNAPNGIISTEQKISYITRDYVLPQ